MTDETTIPIDVAKSVVMNQAKGQLRIALAGIAGAIAGSAFGHRYLPPGLFNSTLIDAVAVLVIYGLTAGWQWARVRLQHSRLWQLAINPRVPNDLVRPAPIAGAQ